MQTESVMSKKDPQPAKSPSVEPIDKVRVTRRQPVCEPATRGEKCVVRVSDRGGGVKTAKEQPSSPKTELEPSNDMRSPEKPRG
jgi:hypothetical protein